MVIIFLLNSIKINFSSKHIGVKKYQCKYFSDKNKYNKSCLCTIKVWEKEDHEIIIYNLGTKRVKS